MTFVHLLAGGPMRIGQLAELAGVRPQTIRFYERKKLLPKAARTPSNYRAYTDSDLERVRFIRQAQQLGFTLKETRGLLQLHYPSPGRSPYPMPSARFQSAMLIARRTLIRIDSQIVALQRMRAQLSQMFAISGLVAPSSCPASTVARKSS
jgi:DNA-binding transcriptional MerR regulator